MSNISKSAALYPALERLAARLYYEIRRTEAVSELEWKDLDEGEKELHRTWVEGLITDWDLVMQAHDEQQSPLLPSQQ
jgi:hypothetical protein